MKRQKKVTDSIKLSRNGVKCTLSLVVFTEDDQVVFYSPALDLYGYGETEGEALDSFNDTMYLYLDYTVKEDTLTEDLNNLGWVNHARFKKRYKKPDYYPNKIMADKGVKDYNVHNIVGRELQLS